MTEASLERAHLKGGYAAEAIYHLTPFQDVTTVFLGPT